MIETVWIFPNRMVVVFDDKSRQIPMLQGRWEDVKDKVMAAIRRCPNVEVNDAIGVTE